ncbi:probable serine/threonine-protein kinase PBL7 isoform X1 [Vitis riparia]|uniref:probable serine/threonine-protein kinase PBL7 isoform X1 n=1 Tax=Vitis riparia TaxID=96939 RepID=UPI00155A845C|nr:probable serine/threonine-protein kinase PBL7 isoform X1 [Vitis riparia]
MEIRYHVVGPSPELAPPSAAKSSFTLNIWGIVIACVITAVGGAVLYFCIRRKIFPIFRQQWARKAGNLKAEKILLRRFQFEELDKATQNFSKDCLLGYGGFGNVYKGTFDVEGTLAIKVAHSDSYPVEEFRNEVRLLSRVKHDNLVGLVGFCEGTGAKGGKILVYEYVPNGSLLEYIMGRKGRSLNWRQRVILAIGAAKGIAHLHEGVKPSIIHRDIKPSNILLGEGFEAKVSDFGLVKTGPIGDQSHVSSQVKGTPGYLDPAYCSSFHLSPFSDVYSFGVILLQLVSARPAVDIAKNNLNFHVIDWARPSLEQGRVEDILDANLLLEHCNMEMMLKMGQLGLRCVVKVPKQRPTMTQVWQELELALYSVDNFIHKQPSSSSQRLTGGSHRSTDPRHRRSTDHEFSQSSVSIDGVGFQRFHVEMDSLFSMSTSLRCLEANSISIDVDKEQFERSI